MSLTLRLLFDRIAGTKGYLEAADFEQAARDADVKATLMGINVVSRATDKLWSRLDPEESGRLTWDEFKTRGLAILPTSISDNVEAATKKAWELFGDADAAICKDDRVTCDELREAVSSRLKLPWLLKGARGQIAMISAQLTFALLGKDLADGAITKEEYGRLLDDLRRNAGVP